MSFSWYQILLPLSLTLIVWIKKEKTLDWVYCEKTHYARSSSHIHIKQHLHFFVHPPWIRTTSDPKAIFYVYVKLNIGLLCNKIVSKLTIYWWAHLGHRSKSFRMNVCKLYVVFITNENKNVKILNIRFIDDLLFCIIS